MDNVNHTDITAEKRADQTSYRLIAIFVLLSWITLSISSQIDAAKSGINEPVAMTWLAQLSSHVVIMLVTLIIPILLTKYPFNREAWSRAFMAFGFGFLVFGVSHVLLMVALRKLFWPIFFAEHYEFGLTDPVNWLYELQKDAYTFVLLTSIFWLGRQSAHQALEIEGRQQEAIESGRLTLTSGGRIYLIDAKQVRIAKAASNYVEIETASKALLVRMTLRELERLLTLAGDDHVRVHRSCLVRRADITELKPNGDGSATIILSDDTTVQASRSYRPRLEAVLTEQRLQSSTLT